MMAECPRRGPACASRRRTWRCFAPGSSRARLHGALGVHPTGAPASAQADSTCQQPHRRFHSRPVEREGSETGSAREPGGPDPPGQLDLTGLPPTPEEVEAFLKDDSPAAWEKVVERLLASPALRRALGTPLARRRPLRGLGRIRDGHLLRQRLALPRLRHPQLQRRQAVRPVHSRADRGRRTLPGRPGGARRDRAVRRRPGLAGSEHGPRQTRLRLADRRGRYDRVGVPRADRRLRPLPRSQVRPGFAEGLLRASGRLRRERPVRLQLRRDGPPGSRRAEEDGDGIRTGPEEDHPEESSPATTTSTRKSRCAASAPGPNGGNWRSGCSIAAN